MVHPFFKVSALKRLLSYIVPVTVANSAGSQNRFLEFILYRNQWQLATEDALYSDGDRYQPYRIAFKNIPKQRLEKVSNCLILGTGLGSIVQILWGKYKCDAHFSLVEYDEKILQWAMESLAAKGITKMDPYCDNAADFVKHHEQQYDMICIDIFSGREVPSIFTEREFLRQSKKLLKPGGIWIMNYIINDVKETMDYLRNVKEIFPNIEIIEKEQNRILIAM
jgi:16S rRNA G1207 methylase RsmC